MRKSDYMNVFNGFGLDTCKISEESIYEFAPVFLYQDDSKKAVIKRTKKPPINRAESLFNWARYLANNGTGIVIPDNRFHRNYLELEDEVWVIYPFVEGNKYCGKTDEIIKAGELLGKIHKYESDKDFGLTSFSIEGFYDDDIEEEIDEDFEEISKFYKDVRILNHITKWKESASTFFKEKFHHLSKADLPYCNGVWDYKANNLIYCDNSLPFLIDPDNAGRIHRLFDLALTLLLFHNEMESAPSRVFTVEEWKIFLKGYSKYVELTENEKLVWQDYLEMVYYDEAVWLIRNDLEISISEPEKISPKQKRFIEDLLMFDKGKYTL
ncbi:MAG: phosphotransferase [Candidatus Delongbacteria bacterium]|nr:phosphotransferase [Candidatus Delongbacteria bacterium]MBN2834336.1 phosphotransferase [Candidatus Delongbacteria bacterium]